MNDQGKYDPGLAASRGVKTKSPAPKGYDPGLERSRRNQQSRQPQRPLYKSDIKVNQAREKSSELPISFLWIVSTILTGIIIQSLSSSFGWIAKTYLITSNKSYQFTLLFYLYPYGLPT